MTKSELTTRQRQILNQISYAVENDNYITFADVLRRHINFRNSSQVRADIRLLAENGFIDRQVAGWLI